MPLVGKEKKTILSKLIRGYVIKAIKKNNSKKAHGNEL